MLLRIITRGLVFIECYNIDIKKYTLDHYRASLTRRFSNYIRYTIQMHVVTCRQFEVFANSS